MEMLTSKVNLADLSSSDAKIRYGCARNLLTVAKHNPTELYPNIARFVELLNGANKIIKWTAIDIIGLLSQVDKEKKVDKLLGRLFELLSDGNMITANHAIAALANIALTKHEFQKEITAELLKVEQYDYETNECRNIALGKVILAISQYFRQLEDKSAVIDFVKRQTGNTRNATKKKAERFLRNLDKQTL